MITTRATTARVGERDTIRADLDNYGCALTGPLLSTDVPVHHQHGPSPLR
jgi:hypothetical protein